LRSRFPAGLNHLRFFPARLFLPFRSPISAHELISCPTDQDSAAMHIFAFSSVYVTNREGGTGVEK
jgi:hypothetical protein